MFTTCCSLALQESITDDRSLTWDVEYDLLGRAVAMRGYGPGKEKPEIELQFASDVFNRRVVKQVQDYARTETSVTVTTYVGGEPVVVMKRGGDKGSSWDVTAQYLWGPAPREIIMAVLPADKVEQRQTQEWGRYYLHQDRMLNVFLCTGLKKGKVEVFDIASFWGFGENSTTGNLVSIDSTASREHGTNPTSAIDKALDNERGSWLGRNAPDRITLGLDRALQMSEMTVWTDKFPKSFRVYVVPDGRDAIPNREELGAWEGNAKANKWLVYESDQPQRQDDIQDPYKIPLLGREGKSIVIAWDKAASLSVREFEVSIVPRNPSCLAFAGQWLDKETGLYYQGARYRLPSMGGKFICPDPLGFLDGDNLYAYAHNDPLTWHDPDGQFAHVLIGGGVGAVLGGGAYGFQVWMTGEEFSWTKFGVYAGAGAASGALGAATFGASAAWTASMGMTAGKSVVIASTLAGGVGGATHGAVAVTGVTYLETGDLQASLAAGGKAALIQGGLGALGGAAGGVVLSNLGAGFPPAVASGALGGGVAGGTAGGLESYRDTGTVYGTLRGVARGGTRGAVVGGVMGGAAWGVGRATSMIKPLPKQPEGLPDPRSRGVLVRTPRPEAPSYGGVETQPGFARHHVKPLSLGGSDTPGNIQMVPIEGHRLPHPGLPVKQAEPGTIFY